jgi:hypothetical protein
MEVSNVMQACFDDGGKGDASTTCVAGYFVRDDALTPFKKACRAVLGPRRFHMVDLVHCKEDFADLDNCQSQDMVRRLVGIIKEHITIGVVISVDRAAYEELITRDPVVNGIDMRKTIGSPFTMCAMLCLGYANRWMEENNIPCEETVYYFESGNTRQGEANNFLKTISKNRHMDIRYNYVSHGFVAKNKLTALDAADLLNWEWTQQCKRFSGEEQRSQRQSLKSLLEKPHVGDHFTSKNMRLAFVHALLEPFVLPKLT